MSMTWICPTCGSSEKRFSAERGCEVCRQCGREVLTDAEYEANVAYQKTILLAKEHLRVGHWDTVRKMIEPFCANRPSEKQLYLMLLMAVTKGYEDFLLDDPSGRQAAERYWDHLERLNCINGAMADYAMRRRSILNANKASFESKKTILLIACLTITLMAFCTLISECDVGVLFLILAIAGWFCFFKLKKPSGLPGGSDHGFTGNPFC